MSDELIKNIEKLIEGGYGDSNRLTALLESVVKGRSLYSSDQKYVDSLISRYLFPSENDYSKSQTNSENSFCSKCGSVISNSSSYCSKCGSSLKTDETPYSSSNSESIAHERSKSERNVASIILGVIGGLIAITVGIFAFFIGTIASVFSSVEPGLVGSLTGLSFAAGIMGIIGGAIGRKIGGTLSIIGSILALLGGGLFGILPFILLIIGGILALKHDKSNRKDVGIATKHMVRNHDDTNEFTVSSSKRKLSKKKKIGIGIGIFLGIMLILAGIGSSVSNSDRTSGTQETTQNQPSEKYSLGDKENPAKIQDTIQVGDVTYKITSMATTSNLGGVYGVNADGTFVVINMDIENTGKKSIQLVDSYFKLVDSQGREFSADNKAWVYLQDNLLLKQLQPNLLTKGQLVFDVPKNSESYTLTINGGFGSYDDKYVYLGKLIPT